MSYIVIPIFSDPYLHPLHKDNGLSLLYVRKTDGEGEFLIQYHPDSVKFMEDYKWLEDKLIFTPDSKILQHIHPFKNAIDLNYCWWEETNKPFDIDSIRNNTINYPFQIPIQKRIPATLSIMIVPQFAGWSNLSL